MKAKVTINKKVLGVKFWVRVNFKLNKTRGLKMPPGCKISPHNSKVSIEQNFASSDNIAVVEIIKI